MLLVKLCEIFSKLSGMQKETSLTIPSSSKKQSYAFTFANPFILCLASLIFFLLSLNRTFKWHFNESTLFRQEPAVAQEFARHFHNISTNIMDCVGCDKCKLWGKLQIHGLGAAFKILTTHNLDTVYLHRHEIVSLINGLTRLSTSISSLEIFNKMLKT